MPLQADPLEYDDFMKHWKQAVGESFDGRVNLSLLAVGPMYNSHGHTTYTTTGKLHNITILFFSEIEIFSEC